jgi:hypothetical protein
MIWFSGRYKALVIEPEGGGYLKRARDYVHLHLVRAGLLQPRERLLSYPWSSLVWSPSEGSRLGAFLR